MASSNILITKLGVSSPTNTMAGIRGTDVLNSVFEGFNRVIPPNISERLELEEVEGDKRFWKIVDEYRDGNSDLMGLVLKCKSTGARLALRARNTTNPTVFCSYHPLPDDGSEPTINLDSQMPAIASPSYLTLGGSPELKISGGSIASTTAGVNYSVGRYNLTSEPGPKLRSNPETFDSGFLIEFNDAITIVFFRNDNPTWWGYSCHAGQIISTENLSDPSYGIDGSGILCGLYGSSTSTSVTYGSWALSKGNTYMIDSRVKVGNNLWGSPRVDYHYPDFNHGPTYTAALLPLDFKESNENNNERLAPLRIRSVNTPHSTTENSSIDVSKDARIGCIGHTKYLKFRCLANTGVTATYYNLSAGNHLKTVKNNGSVQVLNIGDALNIEETPYAWIHQANATAQYVSQNIVHLWLTNDEVNVSSPNYNIIF
jgi:hypothetical protein